MRSESVRSCAADHIHLLTSQRGNRKCEENLVGYGSAMQSVTGPGEQHTAADEGYGTGTPTHSAPSDFEPDERWVPVDRRWCGLDRRSIAPAAVVIALATLMTVLLPAVDAETTYREQAVAGDVMRLANYATFVPEPGWGIVAGVRSRDVPAMGYPDTATVVDGDASLTVSASRFDGDADDLLTSLETSVGVSDDDSSAGSRTTVTTDEGYPGVSIEIADTASQRVLTAFAIDGIGVQLDSTAPLDATNDDRDAVTAMTRSIRVLGQEKQ